MVELPLLQPVVFRGVVEKMQAPDELVLLNRFPRVPFPYPTAAWDVVRGTRMVAKPNVPNSEAHIVPRHGRSAESASWIYLREKMIFEPWTTRMLRELGTNLGDRQNAERAILRDVSQLNVRFDNFAEICLWSALSGRISTEYADLVVDVDYRFPASHTPTPAVSWATATPAQIMADIITWRTLIRRDSQVQPDEVFATENTIRYIFNAFANVDTGAAAALLSDRMRDQYYASGEFNDFLGLRWNRVESSYQQDSGTYADFVPDGALYMGNYRRNNPIEMLIGPSLDFDAPQNYTGKFAKNWIEPDPSSRQFLLEWSFMPVIYRPEQFVFVANVAP